MSSIKSSIKNTKPKISTYFVVNEATGLPIFEDEDGKQLTGEIQLVGRHSKQFIDYVSEISEKNEKSDYKEILKRCIVGWTDNGFFEKQFSEEALNELLNDVELDWLHAQLLQHIYNKVNFF